VIVSNLVKYLVLILLLLVIVSNLLKYLVSIIKPLCHSIFNLFLNLILLFIIHNKITINKQNSDYAYILSMSIKFYPIKFTYSKSKYITIVKRN